MAGNYTRERGEIIGFARKYGVTQATIRDVVHGVSWVERSADRAGETWLPSPVFGDRYEVSNLGRVRSAKGVKSPYRDKDGYPTVNLHRDGERRACNVHRLVCRAFHGEPGPLKVEAAHINGDRADPRAANLKWATKVENHFHMRTHGTHNAGEGNANARLTTNDVLAIRAATGTLAEIGAQFGISPFTARDIRNGKKWRHIPFAHPLRGGSHG